MTTETRQRIRAYKRMLPELRERVIAVALLFAMSASMLGTASYAWLTLSRAPEARGMSTTVAANGNLEIALAQGKVTEELKPPEESDVGDSSAASGQTIVDANVTWGNLVNLSDESYGINQIALRPALLNGGYLNDRPLRGAHFGGDGRVMDTTDEYTYSSWTTDINGGYFDARNVNYGVRAISSVKYANISGNAELTNFNINITKHYEDAQEKYVKLIEGKTYVNKAETITGMDALRDMIELYAQDQVDEKLGNTKKDDYSGSITYFHNLMGQYMDILKAEGEGLRYIVNRKIYLKNSALTANYFKTVEEMLSASNLTSLTGETVLSMDSFKKNYNALKVYFKEDNQIYKLAKAYDPDNPDITPPSEKVPWDVIYPAVACLVDISDTKLNGTNITELAKLGLTDLASLVLKSSHSVVINTGALKDTEQRICDSSMTMKAKNVKITITVERIPLVGKKDVTASVSTTATPPPLYQKDSVITGSGAVQGTDPVAKDTYGMAIDIWMRTNAENAVVMLEGHTVYGEPEPVYVKDLNGNDAALYTITGEYILTQAYELDDIWYYADTHLPVEEELLTDASYDQVLESKIIGFEGENRIWENENEIWDDLVNSGHIAQDRTTQGSGSCFTYYADPAQQKNMTEMLRAMNIAFVATDGTELGRAALDVDNAYSINGKITVPIKLTSGQKYIYQDEFGHDTEGTGIMELPQNIAQKITAIIFLDGKELTNQNVLEAGEILGQLNLQFGSNTALKSINDSELPKEYRTITAVASYGNEVSTDENSPINGDGQGLPYDGNPKKIRVTLTVNGQQPQNISGSFVRSINATQGSKEDTEIFTRNADGTWTADFDLTMPGQYKLQSLIVDGAEYNLMRKVETNGLETTMPAYPTVVIYGLNLTNVSVTDTNGRVMPSGMYMTADDSIEVVVSAQIAAAESLKPTQVRATFDGKENDCTAIMSYDASQDKWVGTARITSSDTYTLNMIAIDGQYTQVDGPTYVVSLGMTAQVWAHPDKVKEEYGGPFAGTSFEFKDDVAFPISVEIRDDGGNEKSNLSGKMEIWYHDGTGVDENGLHAVLEWDTEMGRYTGNFAIEKPGRYAFDRIVITEEGKATNVIRRASLAAVFAPTSPYLPTYIGDRTDLLEIEGAQVNMDGTAAIQACIADAAVVSAQIVQLDKEGKIVTSRIVKGTETNTTENVVTPDGRKTEASYYTFPIPNGTFGNQDGDWKINRLYFQQVFVDGTEIPETEADMDENNSYHFPVNGDTTRVVATMTPVLMRGKSPYTGEALGKTGDTVTGILMASQPVAPVTIKLVDWAEQEVPSAAIARVKWNLNYTPDSSVAYGHYSLSPETPDPLIYKEITAVDGVFTSPSDLSLDVAGEYSSTVQVKLNGDAEWRTIKPHKNKVTITVSSLKPTVTISSVSPTNNIEVYSGTRGTDGTVDNATRISGSLNKKLDDYNAVVYIYSGGNSGYTVYTPKVKLKLSGLIDNGFTASMDFVNASSSSYNRTYQFTANNQEVELSDGIGGGVNGRATSLINWSEDEPKIFPAGKQTVEEITVTYNGMSLTAELAYPVTINQPQCPPYVDFAVNDAVLSTPSRVVGELQKDGTFTVTLPAVSSKDSNHSESLTELPEDLSTLTPVTTTSKYAQYSGGMINGTWTKYDVTTKVYTATTSSKTWKVRHQVVGWQYGANKYSPGDTITITAAEMLTAVVDTSYTHSESIDSVTYKRTVITINTTSESGKSYRVPSGYNNAAPPNATNGTWEPQQ